MNPQKLSRPWSKRLVNLAAVLFLLSSFLSPATMQTAYALDAPILTTPLSDETTTISNYPPLGIPTFVWQPVAGATQYIFQLSTAIGFGVSDILIHITTNNPTYTPTEAATFADREYFWRVQAIKPGESSLFSEIRRFVVNWANDSTQPILVAPANNASFPFFEASTFSWNHVMGAARYRLEIATSETGFDVTPWKYTTLATTFQPDSVDFQDGDYYWRVVPISAANRDGTPSEVRKFTLNYNYIPQLLEPTDKAVVQFTPTFRWTAVRGAQYYELQYSTDNAFPSNKTFLILTRNTTYTPQNPLPNDEDYFWRVRAFSGVSDTDWSSKFEFRKSWDIAPILLTPTNNYQSVYFPLFSWTPVPGASRYRIYYANDIGFSANPGTFDTSNTSFTPRNYSGQIYWKVVPYDRDGNEGAQSLTRSYSLSPAAPQLIYPHYYYTSTAITMMEPHEDRTVGLPIFMWGRVLNHTTPGEPLPDSYLLQVSTDSAFWTTDWQVETENLQAVPLNPAEFTPAANTDYFWRVMPVYDGAPYEMYSSDIWVAHFDLARRLPATSNAQPPQLLRPENGREFVELTPLLEWKPVQGADSYQVQVSRVSDFASTVISETVGYEAYSPLATLGQRSLDRYGFYNYYWRVRALSGGVPNAAGWSETRRFQVAAQSQWAAGRALGNLDNRFLLDSDPVEDQADPNYDLNNLYISQDANNWYFGFNAEASSTNMIYGFYIDLDHKENSGATSDARGYSNITTNAEYLPEYAVYVLQSGSEFTSNNALVYKWNPDSVPPKWDPAKVLQYIGGNIYPSVLRGVAYTDTHTAWAVGDYGNILKYDHGAWSSQASPTFSTLYDVDALEGVGTAWAVGSKENILKWDPDQAKWTLISASPGSLYSFQSIALVSATDGWIAGDHGLLRRFNGSSWGGYSLPAPYNTSSPNLYGVHVIPSTGVQTLGFAVGANGLIFKWDSPTSNIWSVMDSGVSAQLNDVFVVDDTHAWAVGNGGVILFWNGSNWSAQTSGVTANLYAISMISDSEGIAVGANGTILHWNGGAWNADASGVTQTLYGVDSSPPNQYIVVGDRGTILIGTDNSWERIIQPENYVELMIKDTNIGMEEKTGSAAVAMFSIPTSTSSKPYDTIPDDPEAATTGLLRFFANISERMTLRYVPDSVVRGSASLDPITYPSLLPSFWELPIYTPYAGMRVEIYSDPTLNNMVFRQDFNCSPDSYCSHPYQDWEKDMKNTTYFWRARPKYIVGPYILGAWSEATSFVRQGFEPQDLSESITFATPTFSWSLVEGAHNYYLQVDNDADFGSPLLNILTAQNSYTPLYAIAPGTYFWRVQTIRWGEVASEWTIPRQFTITLPYPENLTHTPSGVPSQAPTLCWDPVVVSHNGQPVFAAHRYRVRVARDSDFNVIVSNIVTEQACYTPNVGYMDGQFFWQVAVIDGSSNQGQYSPTATFTKQYETVTLVSPLENAQITSTPTFQWNPVNGAYRYHLVVSTDPNFGPGFTVTDIRTCNTSYTPLNTYALEKTYYWKVAKVDFNSNEGPFNDAIIILTEGKTYLYLPLTRR